MDAKRMLNISGILNTLFFPLLRLFAVCFVRGCAQMISDSSHRERLHALTPAWKTQRGNKCVSVCVCWLIVERAERRHRLDEIKASQRINYRQNIKHGR